LLNARIIDWLAPVVGAESETHLGLFDFTWVTGAALAALVIGVLLGWLAYRHGPLEETNVVSRLGEAELHANDVNNAVVWAGSGVADGTELLDRYLIDGGARGIVRSAIGLSGLVRGWQNGKVRSYGLVMAFGVVVVLAAIVLRQVI